MSATARVTEKARLPTNDVIGSSWNGVVAGDHGAVAHRIRGHPPTSSQRGRQRGWGVQAGTAIATQPVEASPRPGWCREASDLAHTPSCRPPTPPQAERPPAGVPTAPPCVPPARAPRHHRPRLPPTTQDAQRGQPQAAGRRRRRGPAPVMAGVANRPATRPGSTRDPHRHAAGAAARARSSPRDRSRQQRRLHAAIVGPVIDD